MKVKDGDILEFIGISWENPEWEFDFPSAIISPITNFSPNGDDPDAFIENLCIDLCCGADLNNEDIEDELKWNGTNLKTLKKVINDKLNNKNTWKTKLRNIVKQKVLFFKDPEELGELDFKIIESIEI